MNNGINSEARYRTIIDLAPDVIYSIARDGKFTSLNFAFDTITGWKRNKWIGKKFDSLIHPKDLSLAHSNIKKTLKGETRTHYNLRIRKKSGEYIIGEFKSAPEIVSGKVVGVIGIGRDVTHELAERQDLERRKNDFICIASHELKTPVTSMKGFVHLLKKEHSAYRETKSAAYIDRIDTQLGKLMELIGDLLDVSRIDSGNLTYRLENFSVADLVHDVVEDMQATTDVHKISLKNGVDAKIYGDRERISQVLINFINNAIKYSPSKHKIDVFVDKKDETIEIGVRDYGIGLENDEADKIFDRFYRVKNKQDKTFPGLGIGLFISKEIITRHNGKIWVKSKKGQGSTFYFSLPISSKNINRKRTVAHYVH